jgi:hypothetical protein
MRNLLALFGAVCAVVVIVLVARFGYRTADNAIDGIITAVLFGIIATGGLGGHAVAVRLWRVSRPWSIIIGLVSAAALVVNLSNLLGAVAGRGEQTLAQRTKAQDAARDARAELTRLSEERAALPTFTPTTEAGVKAAQAAVDTAEQVRTAECDKRGPLCRGRESEEQARRSELAAAIANKGLTDRAAQLDAELARMRDSLAKAEPVQAVGGPGAALSAA